MSTCTAFYTAMVGPTKRKPRFLSAALIAEDVGVLAGTSFMLR